MYFLFSESLRSINNSTWLQLQLVYFVNENHEGPNLAPVTKEESMETSDMYLFFFCFFLVLFCFFFFCCFFSVLHVPGFFFTNTVKQCSNKQ